MHLPLKISKRQKDSHKKDYGHVLVVGGSLGLTGAVCLSAQAAMRSGAGLVSVGIPESLNDIFEIKLTEAMSIPLADKNGSLDIRSLAQIKQVLNKIDVIAVGPGASLKNHTQDLLRKIIRYLDKPLVIDADALNALAVDCGILAKREAKEIVLTPHAGEFRRLLQVPLPEAALARKELVKAYALRYNLTLVLKGHSTLVSDGQRLFENSSGNPGMATAGTGDVLTGIIAAFIAQGLSAYEAARYGVYVHGLAGDLAAKDKGEHSLIASDIIEYLPMAFKRVVGRKT